MAAGGSVGDGAGEEKISSWRLLGAILVGGGARLFVPVRGFGLTDVKSFSGACFSGGVADDDAGANLALSPEAEVADGKPMDLGGMEDRARRAPVVLVLVEDRLVGDLTGPSGIAGRAGEEDGREVVGERDGESA
jgi:hypothetical protein